MFTQIKVSKSYLTSGFFCKKSKMANKGVPCVLRLGCSQFFSLKKYNCRSGMKKIDMLLL